MHLHIVGAGWAGLAAAVAACERGWQVTLHEASHQVGGRARRLARTVEGYVLDNGQHILIGAYTETLGLLRRLGLDERAALLRLPLDMRDAHGQGLALRDGAAPWHLLRGILGAKGWSLRDKWTLLRAAQGWQRAGFRCPSDWTVQQLCRQHRLTDRLMADWIDPLCLSALNTPPTEADATVFLRVLQDALFATRGGTDFLIPRCDLSALLPDAALVWLHTRGATVHLGQRWTAPSTWNTDANHAVLLAVPSREAARLTRTCAPAWSAHAEALPQRAIATVYLVTDNAASMPGSRPVMALRNGPAQFVFCHQHLTRQAGLLAAVVSDCQLTPADLGAQVQAQVAAQLAVPGLRVLQTIVEKQATFSCTPGLVRPTAHVQENLWACGDYVAGPYPATLEGAVRSGQEAVTQIARHATTHLERK